MRQARDKIDRAGREHHPGWSRHDARPLEGPPWIGHDLGLAREAELAR